jgi:hypothetical protein
VPVIERGETTDAAGYQDFISPTDRAVHGGVPLA